MSNRKKESRPKKEFRTLEEVAKEKERIRKMHESDGGVYHPHAPNEDPLLDALIREHPEKDPAKIK